MLIEIEIYVDGNSFPTIIGFFTSFFLFLFFKAEIKSTSLVHYGQEKEGHAFKHIAEAWRLVTNEEKEVLRQEAKKINQSASDSPALLKKSIIANVSMCSIITKKRYSLIIFILVLSFCRHQADRAGLGTAVVPKQHIIDHARGCSWVALYAPQGAMS